MTDKPKIVLFDIDYTLFDTDLYRKKLYPHLANTLGIEKDEFFSLTKQAEKDMRVSPGYFSPEIFLQKLADESQGKISLDQLQKIFWDEELYRDLLDKDSQELFEKLSNKGITIGLLSTGETHHQLAKVQILLPYINKKQQHIFPNKLDSLQATLDLYTDYQVYLVDDLPDVLVRAKQINPTIITILRTVNKSFERTSLVPDFHPDHTIGALYLIFEIVSAII